MVYGHANGRDIEETGDEVARYIDRRLQGDPRPKRCTRTRIDGYGVSKHKLYYEPADANLPSENVWSTEKYLDHTPKLFEKLRERFGFAPHLLHDVHHRLTPIEAARLGKSLEPFRLFWMEDATPAENQEAFRLIRQHTVTPLAVGRDLQHSLGLQGPHSRIQLIDYIRTTVVHAAAASSHLRRIADLASLYQVRTGCHGATDLSPVCMGAALNFDIRVPNFGIQEYMRHTTRRMPYSRMPTASARVCFTLAMRRVTASTSTRISRQNILTTRHIFP